MYNVFYIHNTKFQAVKKNLKFIGVCLWFIRSLGIGWWREQTKTRGKGWGRGEGSRWEEWWGRVLGRTWRRIK